MEQYKIPCVPEAAFVLLITLHFSQYGVLFYVHMHVLFDAYHCSIKLGLPWCVSTTAEPNRVVYPDRLVLKTEQV